MDSNIPRIGSPTAITLNQLAKRKRERKFLLPRNGDQGDDAEKSEPSEEPSVVLEPQPRQAEPHVAVSRVQLDDETGQRIDLQG